MLSLVVFSKTINGQSLSISRQFHFDKVDDVGARAFLEDSFGFMWVGGNRLYRYDGSELNAFSPGPQDTVARSIQGVHALLEDNTGRLWIGANSGLFCYDRVGNKLTYEGEGIYSLVGDQDEIYALLLDRKERLWIGCQEALFLKADLDSKEVKKINGIEIGERYQRQMGVNQIIETASGEIYAATNKGLFRIKEDQVAIPVGKIDEGLSASDQLHILDAVYEKGVGIWLATTGGLWLFDEGSERIFRVEKAREVGPLIQRIFLDVEGKLWLGTALDGLYCFFEGQVEHYPHFYSALKNRFERAIRGLGQDRFGNLWIGTPISTLSFNLSQQTFPFYQVDPGPGNSTNYVHRLMQDSLGGFWFRMLHLGLGYSPALDSSFRIIPLPPSETILIEELKYFCTDPDGNVWVLSLTKGLFKFPKGKLTYERVSLGDSTHLANCLGILSDRTNERYLWVTGQLGLCRVDRHTYEVKWFHPTDDCPFLEGDMIFAIGQASDGNLWMTVRYLGKARVGYFDIRKEKFVVDLGNETSPSSIVQPTTRTYKAVSDSILWIGTTTELLVINTFEKIYERVDQERGLPTAGVESVATDLEGNVWFSGPYKLCRYDGKGYQCQDLRGEIGHFNYRCAYRGADGRLTFGGRNGIFSFYPDDIVFFKDTTRPVPILTDVTISNKPVQFDMPYEYIKDVTLTHRDASVSFGFSALHFLNPQRIRYQYRLEGSKGDWVEAEVGQHKATFTGLGAGQYTFLVRARNAEGYWTREEDYLRVKLRVLPPWWASAWAYAGYAIVGLGLLLWFRRYDLRRRLAENEAQRLAELDTLKTRLYTNITHEFRTPLTVLQGMADKILEEPENWLQRGVKSIKRNTRQLLRLVNQMLDLAKLESGNLKLEQYQQDIVPYLKYLTDSFHSFAEAKEVELHFLSDMAECVMDYDPDRIQDILSNLLSNAIKFTPAGGDVYILLFQHNDLLNEERLQIRVRDTGIGIPEDELPHIFDRFYQVDDSTTRPGEGTGIGLTLTKELVKLMGGEIQVSSPPGQGTTVQVWLPITREAPLPLEGSPVAEEWIPAAGATVKPETLENAGEEAPLLLIIEDNADVVEYLTASLEADYRLLTAADGEAGIATALAEVPDLIISDVMMPKKDGFEVVDTLKNDERSSHIPIILLTAKADLPSKITGLKRGADAYLAKPFNREELWAIIEGLLNQWKRLQAWFRQSASSPEQEPPPEEQLQPEHLFLQKVRAELEANLSNALTIAELAHRLLMSRAQLFRKIKALTGESPSVFARNVRLEKAKELLTTTDWNISEVAYEVGFSSPAFFSNAFREKYGVSPTAWREGKRGE